jgi:hypothetical protein
VSRKVGKKRQRAWIHVLSQVKTVLRGCLVPIACLAELSQAMELNAIRTWSSVEHDSLDVSAA